MQVQDDDEISLRDIVLTIKQTSEYFLKKWVYIVLAGVLGGVLGIIYASFQKTVYSATVSFALEEDKSGGGVSGLSGLASQFGFDLNNGAGGAFNGGNLLGLMKSRTLVEKTLLAPVTINNEKVSLAEFYIKFKELDKGWETKENLRNIHFLPGADRTRFSLQQDSILGNIYSMIMNENLTVGQNDKKTTITTIEVKSGSEIFSKLFAESLAKEVSEFYIQTKSQKAKTNVEILEHQSDSIRHELNEALSGVASANDNTFNLNPALNIKRVTSSKRQIDVQANTVILSELVKNLILAKVALQKETPLIQIIDRPILPLFKQKTSKLKSMLSVGFLFGFLMVLFLAIHKWWRKNISVEIKAKDEKQ